MSEGEHIDVGSVRIVDLGRQGFLLFDLTHAGKRGKRVDSFTVPRDAVIRDFDDPWWGDYARVLHAYRDCAQARSPLPSISVPPKGFRVLAIQGRGSVTGFARWGSWQVWDNACPSLETLVHQGRSSPRQFYALARTGALTGLSFDEIAQLLDKERIDYRRYRGLD
jgi:hypothetical protein